ncbi:MAG: SurA N-terminal domain-containing protein, partial [Xanthomonadales bacterium]|nr:SurA N-terminal domain-containing protein [Xanthomonadales bacterium]
LAFAILGILVVPFALVGVNEYFTSSGGNIVARVNETEISTNDFNQSFSNYRRRMQSIMGAAYDPVQFDQLVIRREHLDNLIDQELITQAAQSMGLDVDDATLAEQIRQIPAFQVDGQFNADVYQSRLLSQGMSPKQFQSEMRSQFVITELPKNIAESSIATTSEVKEFVGLLDQKRTFNAVLVPADTAEPPVEFSEADIAAWHDSHAEDYQSAEQVIIEYVELDAASLPVGPPPDEDILRDQFEAQKARFISPEQRQVSHILIEVAADASEAEIETARQTAEDLSIRAREGDDFATLAIENSQDSGSAASGGDLGWVESGVMVKAFENAMYELSMEAPISEPVQTGFGWHVIQLNEIRESTGMSFEEARATLVREYEEDNAARAFLEQADRLVDLIYEDPTTLESAALVLGLPVNVAGPFPRTGGDGVAASAEVVEAAFSDLVLLQASVSDPINLDENRLVMIRLSEHLPVALKPIEEVRDEIIATLADNLARASANAKANELLAALQDGDNELEALADEAGLVYGRHEAVRRSSSAPDAVLVKEIFRLPNPVEGVAVETVLPSSNGFAIVQLDSVVQGELGDEPALAVQQYERVIANGSASLETAALMRQLRASADVEVFEDRIQ